MKIRSSTYGYIAAIIVALFFLILSLRMEHFSSQMLPLVISGITLCLAAVGLGREISKKDSPNKNSEVEEAGVSWVRYLVIVAWGVGLYMVLFLFGFYIGFFLFIISATKLLGTRWWVAIIPAILVPAFIYTIFELALRIELHRGLLFS